MLADVYLLLRIGFNAVSFYNLHIQLIAPINLDTLQPYDALDTPEQDRFQLTSGDSRRLTTLRLEEPAATRLGGAGVSARMCGP
ncbi:hypothetical protein, partial [Cohnella yongneupensis]